MICQSASFDPQPAQTIAFWLKWVFAIAAVHPALSTIAAVSDEQRTELNKTTARIVETLLTEICKPETRDALKYEGQQTLETGFGVLGQVAMRELFSDPGVAKELARFASFIDQRKIEKLVAPAP